MSQSDSTTYYEDLYSCSESSTDQGKTSAFAGFSQENLNNRNFLEEDSEPILGLWFEETLDSTDNQPANSAKETNDDNNAERTATVVPDNKESNRVCNGNL